MIDLENVLSIHEQILSTEQGFFRQPENQGTTQWFNLLIYAVALVAED